MLHTTLVHVILVKLQSNIWLHAAGADGVDLRLRQIIHHLQWKHIRKKSMQTKVSNNGFDILTGN